MNKLDREVFDFIQVVLFDDQGINETASKALRRVLTAANITGRLDFAKALTELWESIDTTETRYFIKTT